MDDKQCEIMTRFEDVFGCGSPMRETREQELVFMYLCIGVFQKGVRAQMCVSTGAQMTALSSVCVWCVCVYPAATVHMSSSYRL